MENRFSLKCCSNPFGNPHSSKSSDLRPVLTWMIQKVPSLKLGQKICSACRKKITQLPGISGEICDEQDFKDNFEELMPVEDDIFIDKKAIIEYINKCFVHLGEPSFDNKRFSEAEYIRKKMNVLVTSVCEKVFQIDYFPEENKTHKEDENKFVEKLKEKYLNTNDKDLKCMILTLLPENWSCNKIVEEFPNASMYMVKKSRSLLRSEGVLSTSKRKQRLSDPMVKELVKEFYCSDEISRTMPGKKDYVSMWVNNKKEHVQKRLVLANLREIYRAFKDNYPEIKIGFSNFAHLRPKNCILAGSHGTHTVCVCAAHQNIKLMIEGCKIRQLTSEKDIQIPDYRTCLAIAKCNPPNIQCFVETCSECPGYSVLRTLFHDVFEENNIENISYNQWTSRQPSKLERKVEPSEDFIENFIGNIIPFSRHSFITDQQNKYLQEIKSNLKIDELIVILDFSENYSFVIQDEVQGYHWTNDQATIHPFAIFFRNKETLDLDITNLVIISDCLNHDFVAVKIFQYEMIKYIKSKFENIEKIYYFSDGAGAQYKNRKNFYNLTLHREEFGINAEWNFFSTSHGKNVCDGLGGTLKRLVAKASLQRPYEDQITTPMQLFEWARDNIQNMNFVFITSEQYKEEVQRNKDALKLKLLPSTRKMHHILPIERGLIKAKLFSLAADEIEHRLI